MMDVGGTKGRMAAYLRDHHDKVVGRWSELVVAGVRGRISREEVRRELEDLYSLVVRVMSDADEHADGELQGGPRRAVPRPAPGTASRPARPRSGCSP